MSDAGIVQPERLRERITAAGQSQAGLARSVGVAQATIAKLVSGNAYGSKFLHKIARELDTSVEYLTGETDDPDASPSEARSSYRAQADALAERDLVPVQEIDLGYGMGGTFLDVPVTEDTRYFPRAWLRQFTAANPEEIFFAKGIGDSMSPTIADADILLIDTAQRTVNIGEKIWAVAYGEVGMVKRLRPKPDGSVELLSDNTQISTIIAVDEEMTVIGRVVAVVRKI